MRRSTFIISVFLGIFALQLFAGVQVASAADDSREYKLKAAFLLNFSKFTAWPAEPSPEPGRSFDFCVVGEDPFGTALDGLESKTVGGKEVRVNYLSSITETITKTDEGDMSCHVIFVSRSEKDKLEKLEELVDKGPVATVSDIEGFSRLGGTFEFLTRGGRLSFIVNNHQASQNGLRISASLLNLAAEVL